VVTRDADDGGVQRLWNVDTVTGLSSQMTFGAANSSLPVWSRDGLRLVFSRGVPGALDLFVTSTDGRGGEKPLLQSAETKIPTDWSPDGAHVLFTLLAARTASLDVWLLPLAGGKPSALLATSSAEEAATFSPDGRWVAYQSDELGSDEIFVQPFPLTGAKIRVSRQGGRAPQWRREDGRELYFLGADGSLMAAPITFGEQLTSGVPVRLFATEYNRRRSRRFFAATSDGTRFLVPAYLDPAPVTPLHVTVNWPATLSKQSASRAAGPNERFHTPLPHTCMEAAS
jgi:Tol biopolymer transport system component